MLAPAAFHAFGWEADPDEELLQQGLHWSYVHRGSHDRDLVPNFATAVWMLRVLNPGDWGFVTADYTIIVEAAGQYQFQVGDLTAGIVNRNGDVYATVADNPKLPFGTMAGISASWTFEQGSGPGEEDNYYINCFLTTGLVGATAKIRYMVKQSTNTRPVFTGYPTDGGVFA